MSDNLPKEKHFVSGFKSGLVDMLSVALGALVATGVILLTYKYSEWMSLVSYLSALVLLLVGMAVSYAGCSRRLSFLIHSSIMAFLCVMLSTDVLKVAASTTLNTVYRDTPLQLVSGFILENSNGVVSWGYIALECVVVLAVMVAYRWFDAVQQAMNCLKK
ncbi:hypothetical protein RU03_19915 [Pseudomonas simiae]|uniref:hypothetical protein n=1 Tax=Pseudomonas TaxID=286 RepID=UPI0005AC8D26|nr:MULTISPECIES: hypothetical protein [Pseudomonas]KIQ08644.1 hypothetical protein RU03_19915 [Pseudomonas simiae]